MTPNQEVHQDSTELRQEIFTAVTNGVDLEQRAALASRRFRVAALRSLEINDLERASVYAALSQSAATDEVRHVLVGLTDAVGG